MTAGTDPDLWEYLVRCISETSTVSALLEVSSLGGTLGLKRLLLDRNGVLA